MRHWPEPIASIAANDPVFESQEMQHLPSGDGTPRNTIAAVAEGNSRMPAANKALSVKADAELRDQHERLKLALTVSGMGTWEMNLVTGQRTWSDETVALHGIQVNQINRDSVQLTDELMLSEDRARLETLHAELRAGLDAYDFEYRVRAPDKLRWIAARGTVVERSPEGPTRIVGVAWDVTDLKEAAFDRLANEERLRLATEAADMFAWEIDLINGKLKWAENAATVIGCTPRQLSEDPSDGAFFVLPADRSRIMQEFAAAQASGADTYSLEFRGIEPHGDRAFWQAHGKLIRGKWGSVDRAVGITQNITKQKVAEEKVRIIAERLATAEAAAGALNYDWDLSTGKIWRSVGLTRILGWTPEELGSSPDDWAALKHPDDRLRSSPSRFNDYVQANDQYVMEYRLRHKDGHYVWVLDSGRVFRDKSGTVVRYVGATIDISARKKSEQDLRRQASLIDLSFEPIFVWHPERGIVEWNKGAEQLYGFSRAEALGMQSHLLLRTLHPIPLADIMAHLKTDGTWTGEICQHTKAGRTVFLESRHQIIDVDDEFFVLETNHDVTERKRAEANIARMASIASASHDALFGLSLNGVIEAWNPSAERLFGYSAEEAVGQNVSLLADVNELQEQAGILERVRSGESVGPLDTKRLHKDRSSFDVSISVAPVKAEDGSVIGMSAAVYDITDRKEWEARQLLMSRELAHRVKNSFAVLQAILRSTLKSARDPQHFADAFSSRLHSLAAAQDILTASDWRSAELGALARHQLSFVTAIQPNRITISGPVVNLPAEYAAPLGLIINELATNAIKHGALSTPLGSIGLSWHMEKDKAQPSKLIVNWAERGVGKSAIRGPDGFGTTLIEKSLAPAKVERVYGPEGLTCTLEISINSIDEPASTL